MWKKLITKPKQDKGTKKTVSLRDIQKIRRQVRKDLGSTRSPIFEYAGLSFLSRNNWYKILTKSARIG